MKTDSERGVWGAWAYRTRRSFPGLTLEQAAADLGYSDGALRKTEAGSPGYIPPSRPIRQALPAYYGSKATALGITIEPPPPDPDLQRTAETAVDTDLVAAIREQAAAIDRLAAVLEADRVDGPPWADALARLLGGGLRGSRNGGSGEPQGLDAPQQDPV